LYNIYYIVAVLNIVPHLYEVREMLLSSAKAYPYCVQVKRRSRRRPVFVGQQWQSKTCLSFLCQLFVHLSCSFATPPCTTFLKRTAYFVVSFLQVRNIVNLRSADHVRFSFIALKLRVNWSIMKLDGKNIICV